ncbi:MAG TPA: DNA translocase FtsK 4TM domain-containing protein, partial [Flavobacteriaceae bacterium]|nr:DNA translocase FtsK 4TM domain-containing protein [Flavobacteriaceae bacterium]
MARKKTKKSTTSNTKTRKFKLSSQQKLIFGSLLIILGILLFIAFLSFFFTGKADQSTISELTSRNVEAKNWLNKLGAWVSDLFITKGFGISSFIFSGLLFLSGVYVTLDINKIKLRKHWIWGTLIAIWLSVFFGFFGHQYGALGGTIGFEMNSFLQDYLGKIGTSFLLLFVLIVYLATRFKITGHSIANLFKKAKKNISNELQSGEEEAHSVSLDNNLTAEAEAIKSAYEISKEDAKPKKDAPSETPKTDELNMEIEQTKEELSETDNLSNKLMEDFGQYDPTLELSKYQFPHLDLLNKYDTEGITINQEELEENKNRIVETLGNYNIGISNIKATIGPTVTLYEIVPNAGIRISKIKNLEDDIALSLSALGIRIIAPIPGKGTIGIEVPNKNATIVSMRSVIASQRFQKSQMELPIAFGKTISNETFVVDLSRMPHLLMAGATG